MLRRNFFAGLAFSLPLLLTAGSIQRREPVGILGGQVTDAGTGEVIENVQVAVYAARIGAVTNGTGGFLLRLLPLEKTTLVFEHRCYHTVAVEVDLTEETPQRVVNVGLPLDLESGCYRQLRDR